VLACLKYVFDTDNSVKTREEAIKIIVDFEIPVCLNLAHCYIATENFHLAIKYAS